MSDDEQDIIDEIFKRMSKTHETTAESKLLARAFDSRTESSPSDSSCPAGPIIGYAKGDEMVVYLDQERCRVGLADGDGNVVDIHPVVCEDGVTRLHIRVNDAEATVPLEFLDEAADLVDDFFHDD